MGVKEEIINYCFSSGINSVGFVKCRRFDELEGFYKKRKALNLENEFEEKNIDLRIEGQKWFEGGKTIVSIAFPYLSVKEDCRADNGFSIYTRGIDYHNVLNKYLKQMINIIEKHGGKAKAFVDSNTLPERYLAYISGVGFIGKNNMIITKEYGSYVFLGEIITDLKFYEDDKRSFKEIDLFKECGECNICHDECPTKAINKFKKNCNICLSYITQKKELEEWEIKKLDGRIFGCDSCQLKCPYNNQKKLSSIREFDSFDFMNDSDEEFILTMGNAEFKNSFKLTSCGWRGKNVLKRNALIRKGLYLKHDITREKFDSSYLQKYLEKLILK